jgi:hypothetical protein
MKATRATDSGAPAKSARPRAGGLAAGAAPTGAARAVAATAMAMATAAAAAALGVGAAGCDALLDFNRPRDEAPVGTVHSGDWIQSIHIGVTLASNVDYLPDPEFDIVLGGAEPSQVIAVPIAPVGRSDADGPLSDAERVDVANSLALDVPTDIEDNNAFGAALGYRDGLLLVGSPGLDASRQGLVRTYSPWAADLALPFGGDLEDPDPMDRRGSFGMSVAVADVNGDAFPDALVGDQGTAWYFPGTGIPPQSFDPGLVVAIDTRTGTWGAVVAGSAGSFSGMGAGDDLAVADPVAGAVDTFYWDGGAGALAAGASYTGMPGAGALAFLNDGFPRLAVGAPDAGDGGSVFLCDPAGSCLEISAPDADGVSWRGLGASLAVGDLNRDGADDLVAGAPDSVVDGTAGAGAAVVWFGDGAGTVLSGAGETLVLRRAAYDENDHFGTSVAFLGTNLDEDDCGEVGVGAPQAGGLFTKGLVLVFFELVGGGAALPGASNVNCN